MKINTPDKYSPSASCNSKETVRQLSISALCFYSEENNNFLPPFWWLVYFHLAGDEWQAYFVSHETKCFSMCSKGFHSSAYLTTSEKFNHAICSKSHPVTVTGCFSPFWITIFAHIHKEILDLSLRRVILNAYDLCLLGWAASHG